MAELLRVTVNWTGFVGGPGYTNLHFADETGIPLTQGTVDGAVTKLDAFLDSWVAVIPTVVNFTIRPDVEIIENTSGAILRYMTATPDGTRVGTSSGTYVAGTGACVNWYTEGVRNGRRVRGRTFMVPLGFQAQTLDGTIDDTRLATMRAAAAALRSPSGEGDLCVWSRPTTPGGTDGAHYKVTASTVNDKMAQLRSRRD